MANVVPNDAMVWFEIPVTDMSRAKAFYDTVLKTDLQVDETGPNPMATFPVAEPTKGRAGHLYPGEPAAGKGNTVHLAAPEPLEDSLARVGEAGGKVLSPIVTIPAGRFAYCLDPDGNSIGLFTTS
jgi:hypothetical protein